MTDRESLIKERAYSLWETDGNPDGRHEDHWRQAEREINDINSAATPLDIPTPPEMALEPVSLPEQGAEHGGDVARARARKSANNKSAIEAADSTNPLDHAGQQPLDRPVE